VSSCCGLSTVSIEKHASCIPSLEKLEYVPGASSELQVL
jgi:hypothetical protein